MKLLDGDRKKTAMMDGEQIEFIRAAEEFGPPHNLVPGANTPDFLKVAKAICAQGAAY